MAGVFVNPDTYGDTALIKVASQGGSLESVRSLLDAGVDIGETDRSGASAVTRAIRVGNTEIAEYILKYGTSSLPTTEWEDNPEMLSQLMKLEPYRTMLKDMMSHVGMEHHGYPEHIIHLTDTISSGEETEEPEASVESIEEPEPSLESIEEPDPSEESKRLKEAYHARVMEVVFYLLDGNVAFWQTQHDDLHYPEITRLVRLLLHAGCDINANCNHGYKLLHWAIYDSLECVRLVVEAGGDVNGGDSPKETPLMTAASLGKMEIVEYLLSQGADPLKQQCTGDNPLHDIADGGDPKMFKLFLDLGCDIHAVGCLGYTPLVEAIRGVNFEYSPDIVRMLLSAGAQVDGTFTCRRFDGATFTPLQHLIRQVVELRDCIEGRVDSMLHILKLLVYFGARVSEALSHPNFDLLAQKIDEGVAIRASLGEELKHANAVTVIRNAASNPIRLMESCRLSIRRSLGKNVQKDVPKLPDLPQTLYNFLLFKELEPPQLVKDDVVVV